MIGKAVLLVALIVGIAAATAGCGGRVSAVKAWCVDPPGWQPTAEFKAKFPQLYMTKSACSSLRNDEGTKVWCVGPGEKVTPAFKREYADLYISKAACDLANQAFGG
jgi:hypothetical protein